MRLINLHFKNNHGYRNIGDFYCNPGKYFKFCIPCESHNIENFAYNEDDILIIGGGGLIGVLDDCLSKVTTDHKILRGVGLNRHDNVIEYPSYIGKYKFIGIRDSTYLDTDYWVPCASCMNPLIDKYRNVEPTQKVVAYEHFEWPLQVEIKHRENNWGEHLEQKLKLISSGELVLTNTFHGLYWATLLNRRAIIIDPFSTRFHLFPKEIPIATADNWKQFIKHSNNYPEFLNECRSKNTEFFNSVNKYIRGIAL